MSKNIIAWIKSNKQIMRNAGVLVRIEPVTFVQLQSPDVQRLLKNKYGVTGLPALFMPAVQGSPKETHMGVAAIKAALKPVIEAGHTVAMGEISQISEPDSDIEMYRKADLNMERFKASGNDEEEGISSGMSTMDIHKLASRFIQKKPGTKMEDSEVRNGLESKAVGSGGRPDNIRQQPVKASSSSVPPKNIDDDDSLLDNLMNNRLGLNGSLPDYT